MEPFVPPALVLGCNTPHGINVLSDWIEEHTGIAPDFASVGWSDSNANYDDWFSFYFDDDDNTNNPFRILPRPTQPVCGYGYISGDGRGDGNGFGYNSCEGDGYYYGDGNGDGIGNGFDFEQRLALTIGDGDDFELKLDDRDEPAVRADDGLVLGVDFDLGNDDYDEFTLINEHESAPRFNDDNSDHSLK